MACSSHDLQSISLVCMKRRYILLYMIIYGPKQHGNNIDVYLSPSIEDLRLVWDECVDVDDAYSGKKFRCAPWYFA